MRLADLFPTAKPIIAPIQLLPLPGSPRFGGSVDGIVEAALEDLEALEAGGADGYIIENLGDAPFFKTEVPPETVASMGRVAADIRRSTAKPLGVNALRSAGRASLAVAHAFGGSFIRVNVLTEAYVTDQGVIEGVAADLLRARRLMGAEHVAVFADVHVKHAAPLLPRPIRASALDMVERGGADVLVISGPRTGAAADVADVEAVRGLGADVVLGSGVTASNASTMLGVADGAIVATAFRPDGDLSKRADPALVQAFMDVVRGVRGDAAT
jgi:membrane complex biogenesis BtpA family protein